MKSGTIVYKASFGPVVVKSMDDGHNVKCPRCWKWHGITENFDGLCDRCQQVLLLDYPNHASIPFIKAALSAQKEKYAL